MYPIYSKKSWDGPLSSAAPIVPGLSERAGGIHRSFSTRRIVTSFSLFSPYCRALTFNDSSPGLKRSRGVCCRETVGWHGAASSPDFDGGRVGARTMKRTRGRKSRIRRLSVRNRVINREGGGGQKRRGQSSELIGIVRGEQRWEGEKRPLNRAPTPVRVVVRW